MGSDEWIEAEEALYAEYEGDDENIEFTAEQIQAKLVDMVSGAIDAAHNLYKERNLR